MKLRPFPLQGRFVRLEPYREHVKAELQDALDGDLDTWMLISRPGFGEHFEKWWTDGLKAAAAETSFPLVIRRLSDGQIVGTSSFMDIKPQDQTVEIGSTFLRSDVRGGVVNAETKRLMLGCAFEGGLFGQPAHRVSIIVDARNLHSQAAVAKLGAVKEGVLRRNRVTWTGHLRDAVVFSVIEDEWPAVREGLDARLSALADQLQT